MEKFVPFITVGGGLLTVAFAIYLRIKANRAWVDYDGIKCDLSKLAVLEHVDVAKKLSLLLRTIQREAEKYDAINRLNYRIEFFTTNAAVYPPDPGYWATTSGRRQWPWSKKEWVCKVPFRHDVGQAMWFHFVIHEVAQHVTHLSTTGKGNRDHKDATYNELEKQLKRRFTQAWGRMYHATPPPKQ